MPDACERSEPMPYEIDETHDPTLESWVESANDSATDFPIQNLPLGTRVSIDDDGDSWLSAVTRVGDMVIDLNALSMSDIIAEDNDDWAFFGVDAIAHDKSWPRLRRQLQQLLSRGDRRLQTHEDRDEIVIPAEQVGLGLPFFNMVLDYTDFYASIYHATNVGSMFRPDNPLLPNYRHIPIAYHGRASTIVPSGTPVRRPWGQVVEGEVGPGSRPTHAPCKLLDYELEVGFVVGRGNEMGRPIPIGEAEEHILGMCLVNDWSARDIQKWEYQPLGPFLAKNFATTVSPYIVTMEALAPFRCPAMERAPDDPKPLPYLTSEQNAKRGGVDITLEVHLSSKQMRDKGLEPVRLSRGSFRDMYWTIGQMLTHHASNGCAMQPGDLLASGTVSGPTRDSRGCLLELTWDGDPFANPPKIVPGTQRTPIRLPTGEERKFLADDDEVIIRGFCEREGFRRIGFGECRGIVLSAEE